MINESILVSQIFRVWACPQSNPKYRMGLRPHALSINSCTQSTKSTKPMRREPHTTNKQTKVEEKVNNSETDSTKESNQEPQNLIQDSKNSFEFWNTPRNWWCTSPASKTTKILWWLKTADLHGPSSWFYHPSSTFRERERSSSISNSRIIIVIVICVSVLKLQQLSASFLPCTLA